MSQKTKLKREFRWCTTFPEPNPEEEATELIGQLESQPLFDEPTSQLEGMSSVAVSSRGAFVAGFAGAEVKVFAWHCGMLYPVWSFDCPFEWFWMKQFALSNDGLSIAWIIERDPEEKQQPDKQKMRLGRFAGVYLQTVDRAWLTSDPKPSLFPVKLRTVLAKMPFEEWWEFGSSRYPSVPAFSADDKLLYLVPKIDGGNGENLPLVAYDTTPLMGEPWMHHAFGKTKFFPLKMAAHLPKHPDTKWYVHGAILQPDYARPELLCVKVLSHFR